MKNLSQLSRALLAGMLTFALVAAPVFAGPPLICHSFDIGNAKSLPWVSHDWNLTGGEGYDTRNLVVDTIAILDSSQKPLVHMETLRRATLYARRDSTAAKQLLLKLSARADVRATSTHPDALATFDMGYLAETYKQWLGEAGQNPAGGFDGYSAVKKALEISGNDAEMEFAAALICLHGPAGEGQEHAARAIAGAKADDLLARNLGSHFLRQSQTMAEMITRGAETKVARQ